MSRVLHSLHFGDLIIEDYCAPIVPRKLWDKVHAIMDDHAKRKNLRNTTEHPRRKKANYLLSGILKCARCGGIMNGMNSPQPFGNDYLRYNCSTAKNKKTCAIKPIPARIIEKMVLDELHKFFENPQNLINVLTTAKELNADRQADAEEKIASDSAQLATVRKGITNTVNALTKHGHSNALSKRLTALEEEETDLLGKIARLKAQSTAPINIPTFEQARAASQRIQEDLKSKDPIFVRQTLLGIISEVLTDRTGKHIIAEIIYYHVLEDKKKAINKTVSMFLPSVGAPIHRHSLFATGTIPPSGRPKKKPVS